MDTYFDKRTAADSAIFSGKVMVVTLIFWQMLYICNKILKIDNMVKGKGKFLGSLTALSALAALAPVTGNDKWLTFLTFLTFFSFVKVNMDERMKVNLDRAARNGFVASILCLVGMLLYILAKDKEANVVASVEVAIVVVTVVFSDSFTVYDKLGK